MSKHRQSTRAVAAYRVVNMHVSVDAVGEVPSTTKVIVVINHVFSIRVVPALLCFHPCEGHYASGVHHHFSRCMLMEVCRKITKHCKNWQTWCETSCFQLFVCLQPMSQNAWYLNNLQKQVTTVVIWCCQQAWTWVASSSLPAITYHQGHHADHQNLLGCAHLAAPHDLRLSLQEYTDT